MNRSLKAEIVKKFGCQADFSEAIGVHESIISRVVRGRKTLSPETQDLWAKTLGCSPEIFQHMDD